MKVLLICAYNNMIKFISVLSFPGSILAHHRMCVALFRPKTVTAIDSRLDSRLSRVTGVMRALLSPSLSLCVSVSLSLSGNSQPSGKSAVLFKDPIRY